MDDLDDSGAGSTLARATRGKQGAYIATLHPSERETALGITTPEKMWFPYSTVSIYGGDRKNEALALRSMW